MSAKYRRLADALIADIRAGKYPPGSQLPSVRQMRADGIGLSTVQRALQALAEEGWTVPAPGSGTYVADHLPAWPRPAARSVEERLADLEARMDAHERSHGEVR